VAVVGGGKINGGFLAAGLIDEVSAMIAPGIDGRTEQPALFDGIHNKGGFLPTTLAFNEVKTFPNGVIWARYKVVNIKNKK
jgi:riboflavin biosynthesis pyrimidine reductase